MRRHRTGTALIALAALAVLAGCGSPREPDRVPGVGPQTARLTIVQRLAIPSFDPAAPMQGAEPTVTEQHYDGLLDVPRRLVDVRGGTWKIDRDSSASIDSHEIYDLEHGRRYDEIRPYDISDLTPLARERGWVAYALDANAPATAMTSLLEPTRLFDHLRREATSSGSRRSNAIAGLTTTEWRLGLPGNAFESGPAGHARVWLDDDAVVRRVVLTQGGDELQIDFTEFDAPVEMELPAPEDVVESEEAFRPDAFGTSWETR